MLYKIGPVVFPPISNRVRSKLNNTMYSFQLQ